MNLEQEIQKRFVGIATKQIEASMPSEAHKLYGDLIYYRFEDLLEKTFPRFKSLVGEKFFRELIYMFISYGAKNPLIWKVNKEFKEFIKQDKLVNIEYIDDLMCFEMAELELVLQEYIEFEYTKFSLENSYVISKNVRIFTYEYAVHNPAFDSNPKKFEKAEYFVLFYYDENTQTVMYEEISPFVKEFLESLSTENDVSHALRAISLVYEVQYDEVLEILEPILNSYNEKKIFQKVDK